jgi:integrase
MHDHRVYVVEPAGRKLILKWFCPHKRRWVTRSTRTTDRKEANRQARQLQAELIAGTYTTAGDTPWPEFRAAYTEFTVSSGMSRNGKIKAESVLNAVENILRPTTIGDVASKPALRKFRSDFGATISSKTGSTRSPNTVRSAMRTLMAALRWAANEADMIDEAPRIGKVAVDSVDPMRGRPLSEAELKMMLDIIPSVVGPLRATEWARIVNGLVASGLRLGEALDAHWTDDDRIRPIKTDSSWRLVIPASQQKSRRDNSIPVTPQMAAILDAETDRTGFVFRVLNARQQRPTPDTACRTISEFGRRAAVVVKASASSPQYATAHDLRRTCAQRLLSAGVSPLTVQRIMRHSSLAVTLAHYSQAVIEDDARELESKLGRTFGRTHTTPPDSESDKNAASE